MYLLKLIITFRNRFYIFFIIQEYWTLNFQLCKHASIIVFGVLRVLSTKKSKDMVQKQSIERCR